MCDNQSYMQNTMSDLIDMYALLARYLHVSSKFTCHKPTSRWQDKISVTSSMEMETQHFKNPSYPESTYIVRLKLMEKQIYTYLGVPTQVTGSGRSL
jgi:hypothetical protein